MDPSSLAFADTIDAALRVDPEYFGKTAIGSAMYFALQALDANALCRHPAQDRCLGRRPCQ